MAQEAATILSPVPYVLRQRPPVLLAILPARVRHISWIKVVLLLNDLALSIHGKTVCYAQRRLWIDSVDFGFSDDGCHRLIDVMFKNVYLSQGRNQRRPPHRT